MSVKIRNRDGSLTSIAGSAFSEYDDTPTEGSANPVKSGGIFDAVKDVSDKADENSDRLDVIEAAVPATASANNLLVTENDVTDETLTSSTTILAWASAATTTRTAFIGTSDQPSDAVSGWGEHIVTVYGKGTRKIVTAMDYSVATQMIYTRKLYNGAWTTNWTKTVATADGLTSTVASGSTAPVTSGGVYSALHSYGKKLLWSGTATKGDTIQFDSTGYDEVYAMIGGMKLRAVSKGRGNNVRMKFIGQWCGADTTARTIDNYYRQDYLLDILSGGTVAICGWLNKGNSTDGKYTSENNINVTEIWGVKYPTIE